MISDSTTSIKNNYAVVTRAKTAELNSNVMHNDKAELITSKNKKEISKDEKLAIGLGLISLAAVGAALILGKKIDNAQTSKVCKKYLENIEVLREHFNTIFNKNYTNDEANEIALKYQEAFKEKDNLQFLTKLFKQLNKDYELPLKTAQSETSVELGESVYGKFNVIRGIKGNGNLTNAGMSFNSDKLLKDFDRKKLTQTFAHELKHAQQAKIAIGVNKRLFIEHQAKQNLHHIWYQDALRARGGNPKAALDDYINKIESTLLLPEFRNIEKIENNSPLYQRGINYIENLKNYKKADGTPDGYNAYKNQLVEREAFDVGDRFIEIYELLTK